MVATILVFGLVGVATFTDLREHKIYNWTTYPGILAAWGLNAVGSLWLWYGGGDPQTLARLVWLGWVGIAGSLWGFFLCGIPLLVCFVVFRRVGGGDVKMITMIGSILGAERGIEAMLWTFVIGACMGLVVLVWRLGPRRFVAGLARQVLWVFRLGQPSPLTAEERAELQPPLYLAPSALAAVVVVQFSLVEIVR